LRTNPFQGSGDDECIIGPTLAHTQPRPKPNQKPNNKKHVKKDSNGFLLKWQKSSWASNVILMG